MDEATKLFADARVDQADFLVDTEQRNHDRRERILMAIGSWYASLNHAVPLAMKAESKSVASVTEGNLGSYRADFLGAEFTARVESYVEFDLDEADRMTFSAVPPEGFALPPQLVAGDLAVYVSIFPYANLHSAGATEHAAGSAVGVYRVDEHGKAEIDGEHLLAILKSATSSALSRG